MGISMQETTLEVELKKLGDAVLSENHDLAAKARNDFARSIASRVTTDVELKHLLDYSRGQIHNNDSVQLRSAVFGPIEATASLQIILNELLPFFSSDYPLGFVSGSLAYSPFIKMRQSSDIDLTLVADVFSPSSAANLPFDNVDEIARALAATKHADTAQVCVRTTYRGKHVAIHFVPRRWYDLVSAIDFSAGPSPHRVRRITERPEVGTFPGRFNFQGVENTWESNTGIDDGMYFIDQNDFELDSEGRYVNGVLIDMLAISRFYFGDGALYTNNRLKLLSRLSARYHEERQRGLLTDSSHFTNIFYCHRVFADFYKTEFDWCD